jgi:alpha-amylase
VPKFQLVLMIHGHQPVGNFENVVEQAYVHSYLPFVELLERHPAIRAGLHFSGCLLEMLEKSHPEYFELLKGLVARDQVEMIGGGYYEPILVSIPPEDRREQIERLGDYLEEHFGRRPAGAWLTERVWEPQLPSTLAAAGIEYSLVDDNHFLGAGFEPSQLHGAYIVEDLGAAVKLMPGLKALRYLIPYREPDEVISFLRAAANQDPGGFAATGDDCEKFGVWPGTYEHCYRDRWIDRFYQAIEGNADWLETVTPGDAVRRRPPLGRAELGSASYNEMMEWALPTSARIRFQALEHEFAARPDLLTFLRGGTWRNFLVKYPEANLMQKKMLQVSAKARRLGGSRRRSSTFLAAREQAETLLLRSQCNDAYWHGVFGGLYSPHLRTALWRALVEAEAITDRLAHRDTSWAEVRQCDFDADGRDELCFASESYAAILAPSDGATISALDFRPSNVALINSIARRVEAYHSKVKDIAAGESQGAVSIHEVSRAKEAGLAQLLRYDRWNRNCFRVLLYSAEKSFADYERIQLDENSAVAGGDFRVHHSDAFGAALDCDEEDGWKVAKKFAFASNGESFEIVCEVEISPRSAAKALLGVETVLNFLAPDVPDRYFDSHGERHPLRWSGVTPPSELRVVDEWQNAAVNLSAPDAREFWIAPIETVSDSEQGFERVYQGSQILAVWPVELNAGETWRGRLTLTVTKYR